jgi:hypothetical protein
MMTKRRLLIDTAVGFCCGVGRPRGLGSDGKPVRFQVTIDGAAPGTTTVQMSMQTVTAP